MGVSRPRRTAGEGSDAGPRARGRRVGRAAAIAAGIGLLAASPALLALTGTAAGATSGSSASGSSTWKAPLGYPSDQTVTLAPGTHGALQDAFVDRTGTVVWRYEQPGGAWTAWARLGNTTKILTSGAPLTWGPGESGSFTQELFAEATGQVWTATQTGSTWTDWTSLGTDGGGFSTVGVTYVPGIGGDRQEIFAQTGTGYVDELAQSSTGTWSDWTTIGGTTTTFTAGDNGHVTYAPGSNGSSAELFVYTFATYSTYVTWASTSGTWNTWVPFGSTFVPVAPITYAPGSNGSLQEVFTTGRKTSTSQAVIALVAWENPGGTWTPWVSMGDAPTTLTYGGFTLSSVTYAPGSNGSLQEVLAVTVTTGMLWVDWENPGGAWSGWTSMGRPRAKFNHNTSSGYLWFQATYAPGSNGSLEELFATSTAETTTTTGSKIYVDWENPGGTWSGWTFFGAPSATTPAPPAP